VTNGSLESLLKCMCERHASDLLLTVGTPPQLRIHGLLQPMDGQPPLDAEMTKRYAYSLLEPKQIEELVDRKNMALSRGFEELARFRINIYVQRDSLALAIRVIPFDVPSFEWLGLPEIVKDFASRPHGLFLCTGPAGSGKSTTLAAMIDHINHHRQVHIVCIEDPIEYLFEHGRSVIDQREIGEDVNTFGEALRGVFRQSPDVIMVGEMRDLETMQLALSLAETGHLILATLHSQDTTHAVNRIVDVFPPAQQQQVYTQLSLVLAGIVSQQLLIARDGNRRVLACEVLNVNNAIRNLIREAQVQQIYSVIETGRSEGMTTMNASLKRLCDAGLIDHDVAMSRSPRPKEFLKMLQALTNGERGGA
jgi:twitching motility protein PilT